MCTHILRWLPLFTSIKPFFLFAVIDIYHSQSGVWSWTRRFDAQHVVKCVVSWYDWIQRWWFLCCINSNLCWITSERAVLFVRLSNSGYTWNSLSYSCDWAYRLTGFNPCLNFSFEFQLMVIKFQREEKPPIQFENKISLRLSHRPFQCCSRVNSKSFISPWEYLAVGVTVSNVALEMWDQQHRQCVELCIIGFDCSWHLCVNFSMFCWTFSQFNSYRFSRIIFVIAFCVVYSDLLLSFFIYVYVTLNVRHDSSRKKYWTNYHHA